LCGHPRRRPPTLSARTIRMTPLPIRIAANDNPLAAPPATAPKNWPRRCVEPQQCAPNLRWGSLGSCGGCCPFVAHRCGPGPCRPASEFREITVFRCQRTGGFRRRSGASTKSLYRVSIRDTDWPASARTARMYCDVLQSTTILGPLGRRRARAP
jgi:hypothetical protein